MSVGTVSAQLLLDPHRLLVVPRGDEALEVAHSGR
jgi:hypothetical protein